MSEPDYAVEISNLSKTYAAQGKAEPKHALKDVSLQIPRGSLFALLGPNGAGKSTMINILAGLVVKSAGSARIWDYDIDQQTRAARAAIGVVPQELNLDAFFTPSELMELQAGLYGVPKAKRRTMELLDAVGLADKADAYSRTLSGGMRRRLMVAKAMVHDPPVLVLDEPTAGVDIELRQSLWAYVRELNAAGTTVLLTTHYLEEAEELCDTIAIINHGELVACEAKEQMLKRFDAKTLCVQVDSELTRVPAGLDGFETEIAGPNLLHITYQPSLSPMAQILSALSESGLTVTDLSTIESDLEDVFLSLTSRKDQAA
ncbi:MAG: ABC transporter ATP-binding protein [Alphaproteobacteria bacterium]